MWRSSIFDLDGTLLQGYTASALLAHRVRNFELRPDEVVRTLRAAIGETPDEDGFAELLRCGLRGRVGRTHDEAMELGEQLFASDIVGALFHDAWRLVRAHQNCGHTVVIATSATRMQAEPLARELGIKHVLCSEFETEGRVLTGEVTDRPPWGPGKAAAAKDFARRRRVRLENCFGYANGDEDVPLLDAGGHPHPVNPGAGLRRHAFEKGWPVLRFKKRRSGVHPFAVARTAAVST